MSIISKYNNNISMNTNSLKRSGLFQDIDLHFADYISKLSDDDNLNLWLIAAFVSYYANHGHSAFDTDSVSEKKAIDIFDIDENNENSNILFPKLILSEQYNNGIGKGDELKPLIFENGYYYLNKYYKNEVIISDFIKNRTKKIDNIQNMKNDINQFFKNNIVGGFVNWQKVAAILALRAKFAIISGGPGTGKTTTVGKVLALLVKHNPKLRIKLVAPTGKASDRLNESIKNFKEQSSGIDKYILDKIPESAETIHKFLGINSRQLKYDKYTKAPIDLLLIDEASMVSLPIFAKTFEALSNDCRVILLGDKDQLMAVENGNVLKDITDLKNLNSFSAQFANVINDITDNQLRLDISKSPQLITDCVVQLEHSYRFNSQSGIGELSKFVNNANQVNTESELVNLFNEFDDINIEDLDIKSFVKNICKANLLEYMESLKEMNIAKSLDALSKNRVLCALNESEYGVKNLNLMIEQLLFSESKKNDFYHGRPILITENDYKLNLMNGDVGIILRDNNDLNACFRGNNGEFRKINPANLGEYTTAFAISIHKSQGSEFDNVFIVLPKKDNKILTKELIYTAITRAKKKCNIISSTSLFFKSSIKRMHRQSGLSSRMK